MARFSIQLPDKLNAWLEQQAAKAQRSKNGQVVYLLIEAMQREQENNDDRCRNRR